MKQIELVRLEEGEFGRYVAARIRPEEDLVESIEALCRENEIVYAVVKGAIGSLVQANLLYGDQFNPRRTTVEGPGIPILSLNGDVRPGADSEPSVHIQGTVGAQNGSLHAGCFEAGTNRAHGAIEVVLQEWLPSAQLSR